MKKIAILGKLETKFKAPFDNPDFDIWGFNYHKIMPPRYTLWFDLHSNNPNPIANITRKNFPFAKCVNLLGGNYFNNTVSYLIAYAILKGYKEMKRKRNNKIYNALTQKMPDYLIKAGWFEESKYNDNTPIGGIAAVQNYGATINQSRAGNSWTIVIPPTHFMENCQTENKEKWKNMMKNAWASVFLGNISADKAMEQMGLLIEGDIAKQIAAVNTPPLAESTIQNRKNRYKDKKTTGNLTKRLVDTGQMLDSVSHQVEKI